MLEEKSIYKKDRNNTTNAVVESFKKTKRKQTITKEELESIDVDAIDIEDFLDDNSPIAVDTTNRITRLIKEDENKTISQDYKAKLDSICAWCEKMLDNEYPSEQEWAAIEACMDVADKFRYD